MFLAEPPPTQFDLHFRLLGVPVRVHPLFWLIALILGAINSDLASRTAIPVVLIWVAVVFVSILVHEFGHALTMRFFGESPRVVLYAMGGLAISDGGFLSWQGARMREVRTPLRQIIISFAGPAAGFLLALFVISLIVVLYGLDSFSRQGHIGFYFDMGSERSYYLLVAATALIVVNIFWGIINLIPVFPLDGGQIARAFLLALSPRSGVKYSLILSVAAGGIVAVLSLMLFQLFIAVMFASLAVSSFMALQRYSGGGFWGGGGGGGGGYGGGPW